MKLLSGLILGYVGFLASQTLVLAAPVPAPGYLLAQQASFNPPTPPKDPAPGGRIKGGAKRGLCATVKLDLTALVPYTQEPPSITNVWGLTTEAHPTFWFYVPYSQKVNYPVKFVLQDEKENKVYEKAIALPKQPGVIGVALPTNESELTVNQRYRWFFTVNCDNGKQSPPVYVEGVVKRVNLSPDIVQKLKTATPAQQFAIYAENGIWHEALTTLAQMRQKNPEDAKLRSQWQDLLTSIRLDDVAGEPIP
jgi:Domain of Unknown Function (DUF928)